jgi:hypothetical protein
MSIANTGMAKLVIPCLFLRITQHLIGLSSLLEFVFCRFVTRIAVGMKFQGLLTVSFFNFFIRFDALSAASLPVNFDIGTPAGL